MFIKRLLTVLSVLLAQHVYAHRGADTIHIYFELNVDKLSSTAQAKIDSLISLGVITEKDNLYIIGYADYLGDEEHNQVLSDTRAKNVAAYLNNFGISNGNIKICLGKGQVERFVKKNPDGFPTDRRVDIVVMDRYVPPPHDTDILKRKPSKPGITAKKTGRILVDDNNDIDADTEDHRGNRINSKVLADDPDNVEIVVKPGTKKHIPDDFKTDKTKKNIADINKYKTGETIVLDNIYFYPESHRVREQSADELQVLYSMLHSNPTLKIRIEGHVCCVTDVEDAFDIDSQDNQLSVNRAKYIYDFLIKKGIDRERLKYIGFGRSKPVVPVELNEADANKNRRVEIRILEK